MAALAPHLRPALTPQVRGTFYISRVSRSAASRSAVGGERLQALSQAPEGGLHARNDGQQKNGPDFARRLQGLADRLGRLAPCHRDPHRFHADKSDLIAELRALTLEVRRG